MLTVHLRVNDAATGKPTPVRFRVVGPDGTHYAPFGRVVEFAAGKGEDVGGHLLVGRERWFYSDGSCEIPLPAGVPLRVQITKGPEYVAIDTPVTLGAGQMALRFPISRTSNLREQGWFPGDVRAHFLPPHAALLEADAEDLSVVNLLVLEHRLPSPDGIAYLTLPNMLAFSGQEPVLATDSVLVAVNTLNRHPVLGAVGLLHSHRAVFPLSFGGPDATDDWGVCDWCDQCHRKNGLTVWVEPGTVLGGGESLIAAILGKIDAMEYDGRSRTPSFLPYYYRLLDAGFRLPIVGGSGKDSNRVPLGSPRTYAKFAPGESLTLKNWINAVRAGRTFATTGPLLSLEVEGHGPGETLELAEPGPVRVQWSENAELMVNGEIAPRSESITFAESGWIAARVTSGGFAHSSPIFVRVAGTTPPRRAEARRLLLRSVDETRDWILEQGRFADERRKRNLQESCEAARKILTSGEDAP